MAQDDRTPLGNALARRIGLTAPGSDAALAIEAEADLAALATGRGGPAMLPRWQSPILAQ